MFPAIDSLKPGIKPPEEINVVVEIPKWSIIKHEIDPKSGEISVNRMLYHALFYPYGFIPQTREEDEQIQLMYSYLETTLYCPSQCRQVDNRCILLNPFVSQISHRRWV